MKNLKKEILKSLFISVIICLLTYLVFDMTISFTIQMFSWYLILLTLPPCLKSEEITWKMKLLSAMIIGTVSFLAVLYADGVNRFFYNTVLIFVVVMISCVTVNQLKKRKRD